MLDQIPFLLSRLGMLALLAFLLSQWRISRYIFKMDRGMNVPLLLAFVSSGILMNYAGIVLSNDTTIDPLLGLSVKKDALLLDTRLAVIVTSGLIGGPIVGGITGCLVGLHRYLLGSLGAEAGWIIAMVAGLVSGWYRKRWRLRDDYALIPPVGIVLAALFFESGITLLLAPDTTQALDLISHAVFPLLFANTCGVVLFIMILRTQLRLEGDLFVRQTERSDRLLQALQPLRKQGLTSEVARQIGATLLKETKMQRVVLLGATEVVIDMTEQQPAVCGEQPRREERQWIEAEEPVRQEDELTGQILSFHPIRINGQKAGVICYFSKDLFDDTVERMTEQLVRLLARELYMHREEQLLRLSGRKMKPMLHVSYLKGIIEEIQRTADPGTPVKHQLNALLQLLTTATRHDEHPLREELATLKAYLSLEGTRRRPNQLTSADITVDLDIETSVEEYFVFPFLVTQLVDNALRHAFVKAGRHHRIDVRAFKSTTGWVIEVADNGQGMPFAVMQQLDQKESGDSNLFLIRRALEVTYGPAASLRVYSIIHQGTRIEVRLPFPSP
ncbi:MAG TPA: ATP-binding protein [Exiguobacterium sp.]|nr:ATP-binding protein [Exiguobacterium sp.]